MIDNSLPEWIKNLSAEDLNFIKKFVLTSGSLKEMAAIYGVTYPTVRLKLDRLIQKIEISQRQHEDNFVKVIKAMALDEKISVDAAKQLINSYRREKEQEK